MQGHKIATIYGVFLVSLYLLSLQPTSAVCAKRNLTSTHKEITDLKIAVGAYEDGLYKIAATYLKNFLRRYPKSKFRLKASLLLAKCYEKTNNNEKAIRTYLSILHTFTIKYVDTLFEIHFALYNLYEKIGKTEEAAPHLNFIVQTSFKKKIKNPTAIKAALILAEKLKNKKKMKKSMKILNNLIKLKLDSPWYEKAILQKVTLLSLSGNYREITSLLAPIVEKEKEINEENKTFFLYWAIANLKTEKYCVAQEYYMKLIKYFTDSPEIHSVVTGYIISFYKCFADNHVRNRMFLSLKKEFKHRLSILFQIYYLEGLLYFKDGLYDKAKNVWKDTLEHFPDHPKIPFILIKLDKIFQKQGDKKVWESLLLKINKDKRYSSDAKDISSLLLGNLYFEEKKYENALPFYFNILNKKKYRKFCLERIVLSYYYLGKFKEAKTNLGILFLENPHASDQPKFLFLQADLLLRLNKTAEALQLLEKIVKKKGGSVDPWKFKAELELGKIYYLRKGYKKAKHFLEDVFKKSELDLETSRQASFYLGLIAFQEKRWEAAETYFQFSSLSHNNAIKMEALFRLGCVLKRKGAYRESMEVFQRLLKNFPGEKKWCELTRLELAEIYMKQKKLEEALKVLKSLLKATKDKQLKNRAEILIRQIERKNVQK